jgi:hypothetical protein
MTTIPASVFANSAVYLRVWFNDGTNGSVRLSPDRRVTSVGYALYANTAASADTVAAANLTGTLPDARLSANVALLNGTQSFTGENTFAADLNLGSGNADYRHLRVGGGNSYGYLYGSYAALGDGLHLGYNYYFDAGGVGHCINQDGATARLTTGYGVIALATGPPNTAPLSRLIVNQNGSVGIGTTTPSYKLDVAGDINFTGSLLQNGTALSPVTGVSATSPLASTGGATPTLSIQTASGSQAGALSSADWTRFSGKESALTFSGPLSRSVNTISLLAASGSANGYLASADWTTFNSKLGGSGTAGFVPQFTASGTVGDSVISQNGAGNVSIGNAGTQHRLSVGEYNSDGQSLTIRGFSDLGGGWKGGAAFGGMTASVIMGQLGGVAQLGGHDGWLMAWADLAINSGGGNVGIGTTTPGYKLDVAGDINVTGDIIFTGSLRKGGTVLSPVTSVNPTSPLASTGGTTPTLSIQAASGSQAGALSSADWTTFNSKIGGSGTANYVPRFTANGTVGNSAIYQNGSGYVGIGTASPDQALTVNGNLSLSGDYHYITMLGGNSYGYLYGSYAALGDGLHLGYNYYYDGNGVGHVVQPSGATSRLTVGYGSITLATGPPNTAPVPRLAVTASGSVGIGNEASRHRLTVGAAASDGQSLTIRGYGDEGSPWKGGAAFGYDSAAVIMGQQAGVAQLGGHNSGLTGWANLAINSGGGNVGIGTTNPGATLDVNGSFRATTLSGNGAGLTGLSGSQITGAVPLAALPAAAVTNGASGVILSGTLSGSFSGDGAGLTNLPGSTRWVAVTGTSQTAQANTGYMINNDDLVTIALPASPTVGDTVRIAEIGNGCWLVTQNVGQSVRLGPAAAYTSEPGMLPTTSTTVGPAGYLTSGPEAAIELLYAGNGLWKALSHEGNIYAH